MQRPMRDHKKATIWAGKAGLLGDLINKVISTGSLVISALSFRRQGGAIDSIDKLEHFAASRAAFVTQKKLYGYLKTRMGTSWPKVFADDQFKESINIAAAQIFAASLSDLTIHTVAVAFAGSGVPGASRSALARQIFEHGLAENEAVTSASGLDHAAARADFGKRLEGTDWDFGAMLPDNFNRSPAALIKWAPIADELKQYDVEIVENSMKFAWIEVREDLARRIDKPALVKELSDQTAAA